MILSYQYTQIASPSRCIQCLLPTSVPCHHILWVHRTHRTGAHSQAPVNSPSGWGSPLHTSAIHIPQYIPPVGTHMYIGVTLILRASQQAPWVMQQQQTIQLAARRCLPPHVPLGARRPLGGDWCGGAKFSWVGCHGWGAVSKENRQQPMANEMEQARHTDAA